MGINTHHGRRGVNVKDKKKIKYLPLSGWIKPSPGGGGVCLPTNLPIFWQIAKQLSWCIIQHLASRRKARANAAITLRT